VGLELCGIRVFNELYTFDWKASAEAIHRGHESFFLSPGSIGNWSGLGAGFGSVSYVLPTTTTRRECKLSPRWPARLDSVSFM